MRAGGTPKAAPKMYVCYLCGKEYGSKSISIHEAQCVKKFEDQQAALPREERKRVPSRPCLGESAASLEERNTMAKQAYEEQVMVACAGCGRTFNGQDRVDMHMKGCDAAKELIQAAGGGMRECMVPGGVGGGGSVGGGGRAGAGDDVQVCSVVRERNDDF